MNVDNTSAVSTVVKTHQEAIGVPVLLVTVSLLMAELVRVSVLDLSLHSCPRAAKITFSVLIKTELSPQSGTFIYVS